MDKGNFQSAIYWANCIIQRMPEDEYGYECRAEAYELGGKYEKVLKDYRMAESLSDEYNLPLSYTRMARVYYKLGRKDDAFKGYCSYADDVLLKSSRLKSERWNDRNLVLGSMRDRIIMNHSTDFMRLTVFVDYDDFLNFMEDEYTQLGSPLEYEGAMQLFRAVKNEIVEENLRRSRASDELDALRNKIREERKQL
jgi:tetratricopeptide (TPR) repeat protein